MNLLYILERPIQNDLPYQLMAQENGLSVRVICFEKNEGVLAGDENINQTVFNSKTLYSFNYEFTTSVIQLYQTIFSADTVVVYGHYHRLFRWCILFAKLLRKHLVLTSDATSTQGIAGSKGFRLKLKPLLFSGLYNQIANALFVPSGASKNYFESIGVHSHKIVLTPYTVNEQLISEAYQQADINIFKKKHSIPSDAFIILFCAKLISRKRPQDLIQSFATANLDNAYLVIVGDGPMRYELESMAVEMGVASKVHFTGFVDYVLLPGYYKIASVLVVPAEHEPYGLPVNEAMLCGVPVIASTAVGAAGDLIEEGQTGWTYPTGNLMRLTELLKHTYNNRATLSEMAENCIHKMKSWDSAANIKAQLDYFKKRNWL